MRLIIRFMLAAIVASWPAVTSAECITVPLGRPVKPPPPRAVTVAGAFCGRLFDELGPASEGIEFWLMDKNGTTIAKAAVDSHSRFKFPPVPRGDYRVGLTGFTTSYDFVRMTGSAQTTCDRQLYVTLIVSSECSGTTTISERQPKAIRKSVR